MWHTSRRTCLAGPCRRIIFHRRQVIDPDKALMKHGLRLCGVLGSVLRRLDTLLWRWRRILRLLLWRRILWHWYALGRILRLLNRHVLRLRYAVLLRRRVGHDPLDRIDGSTAWRASHNRRTTRWTLGLFATFWTHTFKLTQCCLNNKC